MQLETVEPALSGPSGSCNYRKNFVRVDPLVLAHPYRSGVDLGYPGALPKVTGLHEEHERQHVGLYQISEPVIGNRVWEIR